MPHMLHVKVYLVKHCLPNLVKEVLLYLLKLHM